MSFLINFNVAMIFISSRYPPGSGYPVPWPALSEAVRDGELKYIHVVWIPAIPEAQQTLSSGTTAGMQEVEQRRSSCREVRVRGNQKS
jgi:hypothetical protein